MRDFSERLWETLVHFNDGKRKVLQMVFSTLKRGVVLPVIDRSNTTLLGNHLRYGAKMVQLQRYEKKVTASTSTTLRDDHDTNNRNTVKGYKEDEWQWITSGRKITEGSNDILQLICVELGVYKLRRDFKWWFLQNIQLSEAELSWYLMVEEQEEYKNAKNNYTGIDNDNEYTFNVDFLKESHVKVF